MIINHFSALERALAQKFPEARAEAEALAESIVDPRTATAEQIWTMIWDKPLYANTKVAIGKAMIAKLAPFTEQAWRHWGADGSDFKIDKIGKGSGTAAFKAMTPLAVRIRSETGIAMHRLYAIQGAANALRARSHKSETPYADLVGCDPAEIVPIVRREMGAGWGHITALHFLTDLGLGCKPDLHLVRAVRHLGMGLDLKFRNIPSLAESMAINRQVRLLVEAMDGVFTPARMRFVDKTLMDISRLGLIHA